MTQHSNTPYALDELNKEATMGGIGKETAREIRVIDMQHFAERKTEIADELWAAATDIGFFQLKNHAISPADIQAAFARAEAFFSLPNEVKSRYPLHRNAGWESKAQIRPSTGTPDEKESWQLTRPRMAGLWPDAARLPHFKAETLTFERQCWQLGMQVLSCFALKLGFPEDFFTSAHNPDSPTYQSTLRLLHYYPVAPEANTWRAGAHTDFDCLTLLFQRTGQGGLQVCPGKETSTQAWTPVPPQDNVITCNIGDMLMRWSDDLLPSNFHRVRNPLPGEPADARYSIAFFCQANEEVMIQGPQQKYPPISAKDYLAQRVSANFSGKY